MRRTRSRTIAATTSSAVLVVACAGGASPANGRGAESTSAVLQPTRPAGADVGQRCDLPDDAAEAPKFDFDVARLSPSGERTIARIAECMRSGPLRDSSLLIVGYADPRGPSAYNRELALYRAIAAKLALVRGGVPEGAVEVTSRGERTASGAGERGWALDRRVELHVLEPSQGTQTKEE